MEAVADVRFGLQISDTSKAVPPGTSRLFAVSQVTPSTLGLQSGDECSRAVLLKDMFVVALGGGGVSGTRFARSIFYATSFLSFSFFFFLSFFQGRRQKAVYRSHCAPSCGTAEYFQLHLGFDPDPRR